MEGMTRRLAGTVASVLALLAGGWLAFAPFALGTQPAGKDWTDETLTDVWTGIGFAVVGLIGVIAFVAALRQHLVERGFVRREAPQPAPAPPPSPAAPQAPPGAPGNLDALLAPLISALTEESAREKQTNALTGRGVRDDHGQR
jgi:hypothetical protein